MQRLAFEALQRFNECRARACRDTAPASVHRIPNNGISDVCEMHPDLMGTPALELYVQKRVRTKTLDDAVMGNGRTSVATHRHPRALTAMTSDRLIDRPSRGQNSVTQSDVVPPNLPFRQSRNQRCVDLGGTGNDKQTTSVLIEPMHEPGAWNDIELRIEGQKGVLQRVPAVA